MILSFKTHINGKPTYFVEKIISGLYYDKQLDFNKSCDLIETYIKRENKSLIFNTLYTPVYKGYPKLHTIREDKSERWKPGMMIDFFIGTRTKNMFRFAPHVQVVSTQEIFMTRRGTDIEITISKANSYIGGDDFYVYHDTKVLLARNDGFDSYSDFVKYFYEIIEENGKKTGNYWFKGKIIHWTNFKY